MMHCRYIPRWARRPKEPRPLPAPPTPPPADLSPIEAKLDTILDLLLYNNEPDRLGRVSALRKKRKSGKLLDAMRKALDTEQAVR